MVACLEGCCFLQSHPSCLSRSQRKARQEKAISCAINVESFFKRLSGVSLLSLHAGVKVKCFFLFVFLGGVQVKRWDYPDDSVTANMALCGIHLTKIDLILNVLVEFQIRWSRCGVRFIKNDASLCSYFLQQQAAMWWLHEPGESTKLQWEDWHDTGQTCALPSLII